MLEAAESLKLNLLQSLFTDGLNGEDLVDTVAGRVPESWVVKTVAEIALLKSGGTPSRAKPEYWEGGVIPWVKTGEVDNSVIRSTSECITDEGLANSSAKVFPSGTLLMAMYGQGVTRAKVAMLDIDASTNQACVAFFPTEAISSEFLYYFFQSRYAEIRGARSWR